MLKASYYILLFLIYLNFIQSTLSIGELFVTLLKIISYISSIVAVIIITRFKGRKQMRYYTYLLMFDIITQPLIQYLIYKSIYVTLMTLVIGIAFYGWVTVLENEVDYF